MLDPIEPPHTQTKHSDLLSLTIRHHTLHFRRSLSVSTMTTSKIPSLLASARAGLRSTFRERAHLPGSPWFAFLGQFGGIVIARTDDPENPIPTDWRKVAKVNNAGSDDYNVRVIGEALERMPLGDPLPDAFGLCVVCQLPKDDCHATNRGQFGEQHCCGGCNGK